MSCKAAKVLIDSEELRWRIFDDLMARSSRGARPLTRQELLSYSIDGQDLPLIDITRGIRNKREWHSTLAIVTSERGPYRDRSISDGVWRYPYELRTSDGATGPSNRKLENARIAGSQVLYFYSPRPNAYLLVGLVHVIENDEVAREFTIELADLGLEPTTLGDGDEDLRRWVRREVEQRLHQPRFREIVVPAYSHRCTVCDLPVPRLLEAAHIRPDKDSEFGQAEVYNGLSLCRNHHRAYDAHLLGIDGDLQIHIHDAVKGLPRTDSLEISMLAFDGESLKHVPGGDEAPSDVRLEMTFQEFISTSHDDLATL